MNFFKRKMLRQIFKSFEMMNYCYNSDDEGSGGGGDNDTVLDNDNGGSSEDDSHDTNDSVSDDDGGGDSGEPSDQYYGNSDVNPEGRPLRPDINIKGKSKEYIDGLLSEMGPHAFMSDEDIKKYNEENPEDKIDFGKKDEHDDDKGSKTDKNDKGDSTDDNKLGDDDDVTEKEMDEFFKSQGLTEDAFKDFPEKTKETLLSSFFGVDQATNSSELESMTKEHSTLKSDYDTVINDPVVAARIEEINSKKRYVAVDLVGATNKEVADIDAAFDGENGNKKAKELIDKIIQRNAKAAVGIERQISDKVTRDKKDNKDVMDTLKDIAALDPKKFGKIKESDFSKFINNDKHKEHSAYKTGVGEVLKFLNEKQFNADQVREMGAKGIYNIYAHEKGWDVEKIKRIQNDKVTKFLERLSKPKTARLLKGKPNQSGSKVPGDKKHGIDHGALKKELRLGKKGNYDRQLRNALESENKKTVDFLISIKREVEAES